jgi:hypothetical protein
MRAHIEGSSFLIFDKLENIYSFPKKNRVLEFPKKKTLK